MKRKSDELGSATKKMTWKDSDIGMEEFIREGIRLKQNGITNPRVEYLIRFTKYNKMYGIDLRRFVFGKPMKGRAAPIIPVEQWAEFYKTVRRFNKKIIKNATYNAIVGLNGEHKQKDETKISSKPSITLGINDSFRKNIKSIFLESE